MIRKVMMLFLVFAMILSSTTLVFASDTDKEELVHIISPEVGDSGNTIINGALFISIYVQSDDTLFLSLKKQMPKFTFEVEEVAEVLEPTEPLETEKVEEEEEKIPLIELEEVKPLTKDEIILAYSGIKSDLEVIESVYLNAKAVVDQIPSQIDETAENYDPSYQLTDEDKNAMTYFDDVSAMYKNMTAQLSKMKVEYDNLFESDVFAQQEIKVDPSFPYFEYTAKNVEPGNYKLLITDMNGNIIKKLEFEVVTEQTIADKIIETDNIFEKIIDDNVFE